ncbi:bacterio-opsin activator domain-containing protein [Natronosalvus halobius]|uniref:bacterio-opsin activator domain-containing protein n=1 Tax=Natronosalvus halobius TaxID=2953746 RepID=UPI0020A1E4C3|nr:bacterio-opsin activator domain-containing protein [Natronosalvus halobius]USZ72330.1 helix-turn-helix domain-containing protein [Natronosalvus halobius]
MSTSPDSHAVLIASSTDADALVEELADGLDRPVRTVTSREACLRLLEDGAEQFPVVVVCARDESWVRSILETLTDESDRRRTIVVSPVGSDRLATAAIRGGADDYVPTSSLDAIDDRVETHWERALEHIGSPRPVTTAAEVLATTLPDEVFVIGADGTYLDANVRPDAADLYTVASTEFVGQTLWDAFQNSQANRLHETVTAALENDAIEHVEYETNTTEGVRLYEARVAPIDLRSADQRAVIWLARDVTERANREEALRQRRDQLQLLNRINAVVRRIIETLVEAPTQSSVEDAVCEQLVASDLYCGAWISRPSGNDDVVYQTGCGDVESYLERIQEIDLDADPDRPIVRAMRENTIQSSNDLSERSSLPDPLKEAAREHDIESALAVPLAHGDSVYGVLTVLARRADAFGEREEDAFRLLGETIGFAINAIKNRRLLFADAVTVLEFRIEGGDSFSFDLSTQYDCTCTLEWSGTTAAGRTYQYVTVDGLDGKTVHDEATAHPTVEECRLIHDGDDQATIEIRLSESAVRTLTGYGATVRDVSVQDGVGHLTAEVSRETDTREIVEAMKRIYAQTKLVSKREADRPVMTARDRRNRIADRLTDRQLTALRLAYYGGYFDWPRGSTGEEIAESMGIAAPTMHQHLRRGLQEILRDFFDEDGTD